VVQYQSGPSFASAPTLLIGLSRESSSPVIHSLSLLLLQYWIVISLYHRETTRPRPVISLRTVHPVSGRLPYQPRTTAVRKSLLLTFVEKRR
jgi:hypothetical protein